jgi:hypothetical protein
MESYKQILICRRIVFSISLLRTPKKIDSISLTFFNFHAINPFATFLSIKGIRVYA